MPYKGWTESLPDVNIGTKLIDQKNGAVTLRFQSETKQYLHFW